MIAASRELKFMPTETKPVGSKLMIPELGISASIDSQVLEIRQEAPIQDLEAFYKLCSETAALAEKHFGPLLVEENLFSEQWILPMGNPQLALKSTLSLPVDPSEEFGRELGMVAEQKHFDMTFRSGSVRLQVSVQPVTFENVAANRRNAVIYASKSGIDRARRLTEQAIRVPEYPSHALMLDAVLIEEQPPTLNNITEQFVLLQKKSEIARNRLAPK